MSARTRPRNSSVGRPRTIDTARVLAAARAICRDRGLDAVTVQAVARRLDVSSTAVRRYVRSSADLIDLVAFDILEATALPATPAEGQQRGWLFESAVALHDHLVRHKGLAARVVDRGLGIGPSRGLAQRFSEILRSAGAVDRRVADSSVMLLSVVCGRAAFSGAIESASGRPGAHSYGETPDPDVGLMESLTDLLDVVLPTTATQEAAS